MSKEAKFGPSTGSLEQRESSLDQLLSQEEHQDNFASYLAKVNKRRREFQFDELTEDEIGAKLAFALKANQPNLRRLALDYLATRGNLLNQGMDPKELILDLAACDLSKTDLWGADLRQADLGQADLKWADLRQADLSGAYLSRADLSEANLSKTDLSGAYLSRADLRGAYLLEASFKWAYLERANLKGVRYLDFIIAFGANFTGVELGQAELQDLNELDQKPGNLLVGASGLVIDKSSGRITGVKSLPHPEP
jgi:uncharacterized protein YjbI with pentapeptide repeats